MRIFILNIVMILGIAHLSGQTDSYKFILSDTKTEADYTTVTPQTIYGENSVFGYDLNSSPSDGKPFFFSVDVKEGNYLVTVIIGSKNYPTNTTVKAESRRLMLENIETRKGEFKTESFVVNIRNTKINDSTSVKIKPREVDKLIWDNKLTLEFNGKNPSVTKIVIERKDNIPTIFLAGNSTVVDDGNEPWCGWGQMIPGFFNDEIVIANYAESGEAANTFVSARRFAKLLTKAQKGDYIFIEFGHNDEKQKGKDKGPYTSYKKSLKYLVDESRKKGMIPVLVTPMHRRSFDEDGKIINTHGEYPNAVRQLAEEEKVALIDLTNMSKTLYETWGMEDSKKAFVHYPAGTFPNQDKALEDNTHFNSYGAYEIAKCILKGIVDNKLPIAKYIKQDYIYFDPASPDEFSKINIPPSPISSTTKPDGN
ncbi:MAG: rhamnogalacturonan acetylesterase [Dysgonomonas sp.]